jgi:hypothetical protein
LSEAASVWRCIGAATTADEYQARTYGPDHLAREIMTLVRVLISSGGNLLTVVIKNEEPHSR